MDRIIEFFTTPFGLFSALIASEWCALAVVSFYCFFRNRKHAFGVGAVIFTLFGLAHYLSSFHPIAAVGLFPPGSWTTRMLQLDAPFWLRRLLEPSYYILLTILLWLNCSFEARARRGLKCAALLLFIVWGFESLYFIPEINAHLEGAWLAVLLHAALSEAILAAVLLGFWLGPLKTGAADTQDTESSLGKLIGSGLLSVALLFGTIFLWRNLVQSKPPRFVAVHYYSWFPENWVAGFSGEHFNPPILPELGKYNSGESEVFSRHLDWMDEAGVNTILFDWWPRNPAVRKRRDQEISYLKGREISFALHYESLALKEIKGGAGAGEGSTDVFLTSERAAALEKDFVHIADEYMGQPNYLRVNDRPVLFVYASRHLVGPVAETIENARKAVRKATGLDLYLVGDEVYFQVIDYSKSKGVFLLPEGVPNWARLSAFDAIGCYNPYDASRTQHAGSAGAETFIEDVAKLYARYRRFASLAGIEFFPGVIPGYNDRGVRPKENHFVIPREFLQAGMRKNFFEEGLKRLVKPFLGGGRIELFTVTSWNEWNEGSQIEPSAIVPGTETPSSETDSYSAGEAYRSYGLEYLEALRHFR